MKKTLLTMFALFATSAFASGGPGFVDCFASGGKDSKYKIHASFGMNGATDGHTSRDGSVTVNDETVITKVMNEIGSRSDSNLKVNGPTVDFKTTRVTSNGSNAGASLAYHGTLSINGATKAKGGFDANGEWPAQCEYTPAN